MYTTYARDIYRSHISLKTPPFFLSTSVRRQFPLNRLLFCQSSSQKYHNIYNFLAIEMIEVILNIVLTIKNLFLELRNPFLITILIINFGVTNLSC